MNRKISQLRTVSSNRRPLKEQEITILPCWDLSVGEFSQEWRLQIVIIVCIGIRELKGNSSNNSCSPDL